MSKDMTRSRGFIFYSRYSSPGAYAVAWLREDNKGRHWVMNDIIEVVLAANNIQTQTELAKTLIAVHRGPTRKWWVPSIHRGAGTNSKIGGYE